MFVFNNISRAHAIIGGASASHILHAHTVLHACISKSTLFSNNKYPNFDHEILLNNILSPPLVNPGA